MNDGTGYLLPENATPDGFRCICVFVPDADEYSRALMGALGYFATWKAWERDSEKRGRLAAQAWKDANDLTLDNMACAFDYTEKLQAIADSLREIQIIQTVSCGCGSDSGTIMCYDQYGNPILTPQPTPEPVVLPPVGDDWPIDPDTDPPPEGFDDWSTFDVEACAAANGLWQAAYAMVVVAEGGIDLIATIAAVVAFLLPALAAELVAVLTGYGVFKLGGALVRIILSEQASDILNEARDWLESNKEEIVCTIFSLRYDIPTMRIELIRMMGAYVGEALTLDANEEDAVREFADSIFPLNLLLAYFYEVGRYMEASAPVDCSTCDEGIYWKSAYSEFVISVQNANTVHGAGDTTPTGTTWVRAWVGAPGGVDIGQHAVKLTVNKLLTDAGPDNTVKLMNGFLAYVSSTNTFPVPSTVLIKDPLYTGSTAGFDYVIDVTQDSIILLPMLELTTEALIHIERNAASQATAFWDVELDNIHFLDETGVELT